jgi:hypothetical protein
MIYFYLRVPVINVNLSVPTGYSSSLGFRHNQISMQTNLKTTLLTLRFKVPPDIYKCLSMLLLYVIRKLPFTVTYISNAERVSSCRTLQGRIRQIPESLHYIP